MFCQSTPTCLTASRCCCRTVDSVILFHENIWKRLFLYCCTKTLRNGQLHFLRKIKRQCADIQEKRDQAGYLSANFLGNTRFKSRPKAPIMTTALILFLSLPRKIVGCYLNIEPTASLHLIVCSRPVVSCHIIFVNVRHVKQHGFSLMNKRMRTVSDSWSKVHGWQNFVRIIQSYEICQLTVHGFVLAEASKQQSCQILSLYLIPVYRPFLRT